MPDLIIYSPKRDLLNNKSLLFVLSSHFQSKITIHQKKFLLNKKLSTLRSINKTNGD